MGGCASGDATGGVNDDRRTDGAGGGGRAVGNAEGDVVGVGGEVEVEGAATGVCAGVEVDADEVDEAEVDVRCTISWTCGGSGGGSGENDAQLCE